MPAGLVHPRDLDAWHRWSRGRHRVRAARDLLRRRQGPPSLRWWTRTGDDPVLVVAVPTLATSSRMALLAPLEHLGDLPVAVVSDDSVDRPGPEWRPFHPPGGDLPGSTRVVLGDGHALASSHAVWALARARNLPYVVAQHGLLTPLAPPLPPGSHLLAWSTEDADFWRSGRGDVSVDVVGSQLLWEAASVTWAAPGPGDPPVWLGQLHAAELSRTAMSRTALDFTRRHGARYRPHPGERDRLSRMEHRLLQRLGVEIDRGGRPLTEVRGPVVAAFSTGVVEAAAAGHPAYVHYLDPPAWLRDFWDRYRMSPWGGPPTARPEVPAVEPARTVADLLVAVSA